MQLFSRNKAILALSLGALAALGACGDDVTVPPAVTPAETVTMSPSNANMNVNEELNFAVQITGSATLASCTSSSATVATAAVSGSACKVTAKAPGNASITATTSTGKSAAAAVSVANLAPAISGINITPAAVNVGVAAKAQITANPTTQATGTALTRTFSSSNAAIATVSATGEVTGVAAGQATITVTITGSATGASTASVTGQVPVTVTATAPAITGVEVTSPLTVSLLTGGTAQIAATATTAAAGLTSTITYGSSAPSVALVSNSGQITAVSAGAAVITVTASSAGNATFAASSATAQIAVVVTNPAQLSIASITRTVVGTGEIPVDINAVAGQIQINANLLTNGQNVSSIAAWVCRVGEAVADCAARSGTPAAQQSFGAGGAANGIITLSINTADFTVASDYSSTTVKHNNGQNVIVATISAAGALGTANNNLAILNFTNADGFVASHTAPATTANSSTGVAYFGGPGANGRGSITIAPVTYTAGRTIIRATAGVPSVAGCTGSVSFSPTTARPWTYTYGYTTADVLLGTSNSLTNVICNNAVTTADLTPVVSASTYSDNTPGPTATGAQQTADPLTAVANTFRTVSSSTMPVAAPASIRVDYVAPTGGSFAIPGSGWTRASTRFTTTSGLLTGILTAATDVGVGVPASSSLNIRYLGCSATAGDTTTFAMPTLTGADIPECAISNANTVYQVRYYVADRLGNLGTNVTSTAFGMDKTAPLVRYAEDAAADRTINPEEANAFQIEALDERSGLTTTPSHSLARTIRASESTLGMATGALSSCVVGTVSAATGVIGSAFVSAPGCDRANFSFSATQTADGYLKSTPVTTATLTGVGDGYYVYRVRVSDEAGNTVDLPRRAVLINGNTWSALAFNGTDAVGTVRATQMIAPITSTYAGPFTGVFIGTVETAGTGLSLNYGPVVLAYPMVATSAIAFDDVITRDSLASHATPFTTGVRLYTDIEGVNGSNAPAGAAGTLPVVGSGIYAQNLGGNGATSFADFLSGSVTADATTWGAKVTGGAAITTWQVVSSAASFNSPEGGLKAQVAGPANTFNSPFTRVDFYRLIEGTPPATTTWEYVGSVDASATPCTNVSQTCGVYIGENANANTRVITYVLRTAGTGARSTETIALNDGNYVAIGTRGTAGRGLLANPLLYELPEEEETRRR